MDISEHWVVKPPRWDGKITEQHVVNAIEVDDFRTQGWTVEGPFVPASQLRGAVEALRETRAMLAQLAVALDHNGMHEDAEAARAVIVATGGGQ